MGLRQSDIACLTQGKGARALGQGPFHPSPSGIDGLERRCRLALSSDLECLVLRLGSELNRPGTRLGLGTVCAHRAHGTMGGVKLDGDQLLASVLVVPGGSPSATAMPLRTRDGLCLPINGKTRHIEALWTAGLPTRVGQHGPHEFYGMREAAGHQVFGIDIARIQEVFTREQALGREMGMNDGR